MVKSLYPFHQNTAPNTSSLDSFATLVRNSIQSLEAGDDRLDDERLKTVATHVKATLPGQTLAVDA